MSFFSESTWVISFVFDLKASVKKGVNNNIAATVKIDDQIGGFFSSLDVTTPLR